ncbi:alpha/beta fold hydrolase [Streptomyces mutabilis]|uniref:alpha/beta fold hydrolase n=1 Tax=Streptomyces mutabilis TaxID=67332 RepID=UPI000693F6D9|nr:alpha/beta hydrolase [Streptomyces mutabilis]
MDGRNSTERTLTSPDGTVIAVTVTGAGRPLVLVPGSMGAARDWQPLADRLAPRLTVHAVDRRGHGRSGDQPSYDITREQEDIEAAMAAAGPGAVLFGHSYGGLIATAVALRQRPTALVLYDPGLSLHGPLGGPATADIERAVAAGDHEGALVVGLREVMGVPADGIEQFRVMPQWGTFVRRIATWPRELRAVDAARFTLAGLAADLTGPVLIVTGEHSPGSLGSVVRSLHQALPASTLVQLAGVGHDAHLEDPDALAQVLREFTGSLPDVVPE